MLKIQVTFSQTTRSVLNNPLHCVIYLRKIKRTDLSEASVVKIISCSGSGKASFRTLRLVSCSNPG